MTKEEWEQKLKNEGYTHVVTHIDSPSVYYVDHEHPVDTVHVVLTGTLTVRMNDQTKVYNPGDCLYLAKHVIHDGAVGPNGCTFLTGIKV